MKISVPSKAIIVVADGKQAHYYSNVGTTDIKLEKMDDVTSTSATPHHAANLPSETSPGEKDEADFAAQLANTLYERFHNSNTKSLVIVADPQTLGQLRKSLHEEITKKLTGELNKTLTHASIDEIENSLRAAS